jgi:hypothetical protein
VKIYEWNGSLSLEEQKDGAYWERNMIALRFADGWYSDDVPVRSLDGTVIGLEPRYVGWSRVLSLDSGKMTFHIPDNFKVGNLPEIKPNWDGHTTKQKWQEVLKHRGIECSSSLK